MKRILSIVCCAAMLFVMLAACNKTTEPPASTPGGGTVSPSEEGTERPLVSPPVTKEEEIGFPKKELSDPDVTLFLCFDITDDNRDDIMSQVAAYEERYDGKVEIIQSTWLDRMTKLAQLINSGEPPDVVSVATFDMPIFATRDLLQPIDGYTDLDNSIYLRNIIDLVYNYQDSNYAVCTIVVPRALYFNRTMFEKADVTAPDVLYAEGNWNWDTFRKTALDMTEFDDAGEVSVAGFSTWIGEVFLVANGTDIVKKENGKPVLNISDPKVMEALQFYQDMVVKDRSISRSYWEGWQFGFPDKKVAMGFLQADSEITRLKNLNFNDEIGIVPFPTGPSQSTQVNYVATTGYGLAKDAKNPEGGAAFIEEYLTESYKRTISGVSLRHLTDDQFNVLSEMMSQPMMPSLSMGYGDMFNKFTTMLFEITDDMPVGTTLEKYAPELQAQIDRALSQ